MEWFQSSGRCLSFRVRDLFEGHFARFDAKLEQRIAEVKAELESKFAGIDTKFGGLEARLVKWMFLFWVGTLGTLIALQRLH